jgi:hypothetical protein
MEKTSACQACAIQLRIYTLGFIVGAFLSYRIKSTDQTSFLGNIKPLTLILLAQRECILGHSRKTGVWLDNSFFLSLRKKKLRAINYPKTLVCKINVFNMYFLRLLIAGLYSLGLGLILFVLWTISIGKCSAIVWGLQVKCELTPHILLCSLY